MDYFPVARRIVASSDAVGIVARDWAQSDAFHVEFELLDAPDLFPPAALCCAFQERRELSPAGRALINTLRQHSNYRR